MPGASNIQSVLGSQLTQTSPLASAWDAHRAQCLFWAWDQHCTWHSKALCAAWVLDQLEQALCVVCSQTNCQDCHTACLGLAPYVIHVGWAPHVAQQLLWPVWEPDRVCSGRSGYTCHMQWGSSIGSSGEMVERGLWPVRPDEFDSPDLCKV